MEQFFRWIFSCCAMSFHLNLLENKEPLYYMINRSFAIHCTDPYKIETAARWHRIPYCCSYDISWQVISM